ncbi:MAG: DUF2634 domain-containing protein [Tissierellia bacterium]|nr:DUF2634 domain-containing protein [Tissierellia bacterium]
MVLPYILNRQIDVIDEEVYIPDDYYEYAYDFENNELLTRDGKHYYVYGNEALKIWIYKAVRSDRFRYSAYSSRFGTEIFSLIGEVISEKLKKEEIKRYIIETVMVNPYIQSIEKIELKSKKSVMIADVYITSKFDNEVVNVECDIPI